MKTIYLARHGKVENPNNIFYTSNYPLGAQGTQQAKLLGADMKKFGCNPVHIKCSPYLRTRETAEIIAQALGGHEVETDERLIEWQVGEWFGKPLEAFREAAGYNQIPFHLQLQDIEQFDAISTRVIAAINSQLEIIPENGCSILVSHRESMVSAILKLQGKTNWQDIPVLDFPPASCWKLDFEGSRLILATKAFDQSKVLA